MERLTEKFKDGRNILRKGISDVFHVGFGRFFEGKAVDRLTEYEDLEEQGKLLKLPCVVGDTVWNNDFGRPCSYEVTGFSFGNLNDGCVEEKMVLDQVLVHYTNSTGSITGSFAESEIGKTVFLTREEAEAALNNGNY